MQNPEDQPDLKEVDEPSILREFAHWSRGGDADLLVA